ncbi:hypothetical protein [Streptomyces sp. NPDC000410]
MAAPGSLPPVRRCGQDDSHLVGRLLIALGIPFRAHNHLML